MLGGVLSLTERLRHRFITSICFAPDGNRIVTSSETTKIWDVATGRELLTVKGHDDIIEAVCFSPDGKRLLTGSADGMAKLWDARQKDCDGKRRGDSQNVGSVKWQGVANA